VNTVNKRMARREKVNESMALEVLCVEGVFRRAQFSAHFRVEVIIYISRDPARGAIENTVTGRFRRESVQLWVDDDVEHGSNHRFFGLRDSRAA
jgi:hypothetical protein